MTSPFRSHARWLWCPLFIGNSLLTVSGSLAQTPAHGEEKSQTFDVASVRLSAASQGPTRMETPPGRFHAVSVPLRLLIIAAYGIKDYQLTGAPAWIDTTRLDVEATAERDPDLTSFRAMLQSLLADRFHLTVHRDTRTLPLYELTAKANRSKDLLLPNAHCASLPLEPAIGGQVHDGPTADCGMFSYTRGHLTGKGVTMAALAYTFSNVLRQTVVDKTDLDGAFDVDISWSSDSGSPPTSPSLADTTGPSIFTAVRDAGLELRAAKGPVEVVVVDRVDKLEDN
jgi:uncharacterized protein (TIGR03435 family)